MESEPWYKSCPCQRWFLFSVDHVFTSATVHILLRVAAEVGNWAVTNVGAAASATNNAYFILLLIDEISGTSNSWCYFKVTNINV